MVLISDSFSFQIGLILFSLIGFIHWFVIMSTKGRLVWKKNRFRKFQSTTSKLIHTFV